MQHRATISILLAAGVLAGCVTAPEEETVTDLVFASVSAGFLHTCGVTTGGTAHCWGWNVFAQLGNGDTTSKVTPVPVAGGLTFALVNAAWKHTCGLTTSGTAYCWGDNHRRPARRRHNNRQFHTRPRQWAAVNIGAHCLGRLAPSVLAAFGALAFEP